MRIPVPEGFLLELRQGFAALAAAAIGTAAGIFADSTFALRRPIVEMLYRSAGPLFDLIGNFPNGQLMLSAFLDRVPILLLVGLAIGLLERYLRFRALLLGCVLVWPGLLGLRRLASWIALASGDGEVALAFFASVLLPQAVSYCMQYAFLFVVIRGTSLLLAMTARKPAPA